MSAGGYALKVPQMREAVQQYQQGRSLRQIGDDFGVSQNAVKNALAYCGITPRPKHEARRLRWSVQ